MYNELVEERLSQLTKAFKISKLEEDKETLTQELKEGKEALTKEIPKRAKQYPPLQWSNETSINCGVKAKEQKNDPSASSPSVPRGLKHILSPETVDDLWPKHLEVADDWSAPSLGDVTPTSSKGS